MRLVPSGFPFRANSVFRLCVFSGCLSGLAMSMLFGPQVSGFDRRQRKGKETQVANKTDTNATFSAGGTVPTGEDHPLMMVLTPAKESREALKSVKDYTAQFHKRERISGKMIEQQMDLKLREKEISVYLKVQKPHTGREVLYVAGRNQGKLLVREQGFRSLVGTVAILPTGSDAMSENRYPITEIGITKLLDTLITQWEKELKQGDVAVKVTPGVKLAGMTYTVLESSHPVKHPEFKFQKTRLFIDENTKLPLRVEQYGFPEKANGESPLIEEYSYTNLKLNPGLTDHDFDTKNPNYRFK